MIARPHNSLPCFLAINPASLKYNGLEMALFRTCGFDEGDIFNKFLIIVVLTIKVFTFSFL